MKNSLGSDSSHSALRERCAAHAANKLARGQARHPQEASKATLIPSGPSTVPAPHHSRESRARPRLELLRDEPAVLHVLPAPRERGGERGGFQGLEDTGAEWEEGWRASGVVRLTRMDEEVSDGRRSGALEVE